MSERKSVTREELATALDTWFFPDDSVIVVPGDDLANIAEAIFDALPATPPASETVNAALVILSPEHDEAMRSVKITESWGDMAFRDLQTMWRLWVPLRAALDEADARYRAQMEPLQWLGPCCTHPTPGCVVCGFRP